MVGKAMLTILLSSVDMKVPNIIVPRIIHLLGDDAVVVGAGDTDTGKSGYFCNLTG
ncbi:hypothetical protein GCM10028810_32880 [Spirosoma litoris]